MVLEEALAISLRMKEIDGQIAKLKDECGITELEKEFERLMLDKAALLEKAAMDNITREGTIMLVDRGRHNRVLRPREFHEAHPAIFWRIAKAPVTSAERLLREEYEMKMEAKDAKRAVKDEIDPMCDIDITHVWDVVDLG